MADAFFTIHRNALLEAITTVYPAVDTRSKIPVLNHMRLTASADRMRIVSTNLDLQIETECEPLAIGAEKDFVIPADKVKAFVTNLPEDAEIGFGAARLEWHVSLLTARSRVAFPVLQPQDFPSLATGNIEMVPVDGPEIASAFEKTLFAISRLSDRPYLTGICLHEKCVDGVDGLTVFATDAYIGAHVRCGSSIPHLPENGGMQHVILPEKFCAAVKALAAKEKAPMRMGASDSLVVAECGHTVITSKLIDANYVDYMRIVPPQGPLFADFEIRDLASAIQRVAIVEDGERDAILLRISKGAVTLTLNNPAVGAAWEDVRCETEIDTYEIGFNASQMLSILKHMSGSKARIFFGEGIRTLRVESVGLDDIFLVQPFRPRIAPEVF